METDETATEEKKKPKIRSVSRSKVTVPSRVFSFGVLRPEKKHEDMLISQVKLAMEYQGLLIAGENKRRMNEDDILSASSKLYADAKDELRALNEKLDKLYEDLSLARRRKRKRVYIPELEKKIEALREERKAHYEVLKAERKKARKPLKEAYEAFGARKSAMIEAAGAKNNTRVMGEIISQLSAEMQKEDWPEAWKLLNDNELEFVSCTKRLRAINKILYTDTKEFMLEAFQAQKARTLSLGGDMNAPRGIEGRIGIRFDKEPDAIIGDDGTISTRKFKLADLGQESIGKGADRDSNRSRQNRRMLATFRFGKGDESEMTFKVLVHRKLPPGARVKRAWVMIRREGYRFRYQLQVTLQDASLNDRPGVVRHDAVAVKLGWAENRIAADITPELITATWMGTDGEHGTVILDSRTNASLLNTDALQKHQDDYHNEALHILGMWSRFTNQQVSVMVMNKERELVEKTLREALRTSDKWKTPRRLAGIVMSLRKTVLDPVLDMRKLWKAWKETCSRNGADFHQPFPRVRRWCKHRGITDQLMQLTIFLEWWRIKNSHLYKYMTDEKLKAQRRRKDTYRVAAARLSSRYQNLIILDLGLKKIARKKRAEKKVEGPEKRVTGQRRRAAPSVLSSALANAFRVKEKGVKVQEKTLEDALSSYLKSVGTAAQ